jgi:hypothetical protein
MRRLFRVALIGLTLIQIAWGVSASLAAADPQAEPKREPAKVRRPQEPKRPFPYDEEEVQFDNPRAKVKLSGTFTHPKGPGPFPAVLLVAGSGPHTRDEVAAGHRVLLVLSDYLTCRGLAVLRYDKRGVAKSTDSSNPSKGWTRRP